MTPSEEDRVTPDEPITELIRGLFSDARALAGAHVDGIRLEVREEVNNLKSASVRAGAALGLFACAGLLAAFAAAQALWMYTALPPWGAALIIAGIFSIGGLLAVLSIGEPKELDLIPERELEATKEDAKWLAHRTREAVS